MSDDGDIIDFQDRLLLEKHVEELATLSPIEYDLQRGRFAENLGIRKSALDQAVQAHRHDTGDLFQDIEPWSEPVDGPTLFAELICLLERFVKLPAGAAYTCALWILHTHTFDAAQISPILCVTSPEKRCGKTTLLSLLQGLVRRPMAASNITFAALFRATEKWQPTLLIDEADSFLRASDELRGVLNSGHNRSSAFVIRTVGDKHEPRAFTTWAPKAIALIGRMPPTLEDRSITVRMQRKRPGESVERFRLDRVGEYRDLAAMCARWGQDNLALIRQCEPELPAGLNDRAGDNWRTLFSVAEVLGTAKFAHRAIEALGTVQEDEAAAIMLLDDIRTFLQVLPRIASADLARQLGEIEERPWPEWRQGKPITARQVARLLGPFGIKPKQLRIAGPKTRGYESSQFKDVFFRYLTPISSGTPVQANGDAGFSGFRSGTPDFFVPDENRLDPASDKGCTGVPDENPLSDEEEGKDDHG